MTEVVTVTDAQFIDAFNRAITQRGEDFVYTRPVPEPGLPHACYYRHPLTGKPDCVIGLTLDILGITVPVEHEGSAAYNILPQLVHGLSKRVLLAADSAQEAQDFAHPYRAVRARFNETLTREV